MEQAMITPLQNGLVETYRCLLDIRMSSITSEPATVIQDADRGSGES